MFNPASKATSFDPIALQPSVKLPHCLVSTASARKIHALDFHINHRCFKNQCDDGEDTRESMESIWKAFSIANTFILMAISLVHIEIYSATTDTYIGRWVSFVYLYKNLKTDSWLVSGRRILKENCHRSYTKIANRKVFRNIWERASKVVTPRDFMKFAFQHFRCKCAQHACSESRREKQPNF